jgi:hypothetical protein
MLTGALVIVLASFLITMKVLDYWGTLGITGEILVRSATYGGDCSARTGNATDKVQSACGGKASCAYEVSVNTLGDTAPGCPKDFFVEYACGANSPSKTTNAPAEANGKTVHLSCP